MVFHKGISKAICGLVIYVCIHTSWERSKFLLKNPIFKAFVATRCSILSFVDYEFISLDSLAATCYLEWNFKRKGVHFEEPVFSSAFSNLKGVYLFRATYVFFPIFCVNNGYQEIRTNQKAVGLWTCTASNLHNSAFRNSFCLYKSCNFVMIFLEDFIAMNSPL